MGGYDSALTEATIREAWDRTLQNGPTLIDTAEVYGSGESERIIGRLLATTPDARSRIVLATKWWPAPWRLDVTSGNTTDGVRCAPDGARRRRRNVGQLSAPKGGLPICDRIVSTGGFVSARRCQFAPSTTSVWPEMNWAYGDARKVAAQPSSRGWPDRMAG